METLNVTDRIAEGVRIPEGRNFIHAKDKDDRRRALEILGLPEDASILDAYKALKLRLAVGADRLDNISDFNVWYSNGEWGHFLREFKEGEKTDNLRRTMEHFGLNSYTATNTELMWAIRCEYPELPEYFSCDYRTDGQVIISGNGMENIVIKFNTSEESSGEISSIQEEINSSI